MKGQKETEKPTTAMLQYKFAFFALFAARGIVVSFYPLYLKKLGLTAEKIGIVMFSRPVGGFIGGGFISFLTSYFNNYSTVLYSMTCLFLVSGISIDFLSPPQSAVSCNDYPNGLVSNVSFVASSDQQFVYEGNSHYLFVLSFIIGFAVDFSGIGIDTIQHGVTLMALEKGNTEMYGWIRAWGALGHATGAVSTGLLLWSTQYTLKLCTQFVTTADYHFFTYSFVAFAFALLLSVNSTCISTEKSKEASVKGKEDTTADKEELETPWTVTILPWLFLLMSRSMFCAASQGFLNVHMDDIGASPLLIGISNGATTTTEFVMFFLTPFLIRKFGHRCLVIVGITSYIIRFWMFSVVTQPLYILPVEIFEGMMYAVLWSSVVSHLSSQVSRSKQSQMQGVILSVHMLGTGIGFLLSGYLTRNLGAQMMFRIFACMAMFSSLVFITSQAVSVKCNTQQQQQH